MPISPDGKKAVCSGMDEDHHISVLDLESGKIITTRPGSKKIIMKIVWTGSNQFVTVGLDLYKLWELNGNTLSNGV